MATSPGSTPMAKLPKPPNTRLHASCVASNGRALLILGESGAGKTGLALELMLRGASLVSDDQVELQEQAGRLMASAPATIRGKIELRGFGIVDVSAFEPQAEIAFAIRLQDAFPERFPENTEEIELLGCRIPLFWANAADRFLPAKALIFLQSLAASSPSCAIRLASPDN